MALLFKTAKKIIVGPPLTIFVPYAIKALMNSHHTQHFSVGCLIFYEVLLLTGSHIILLYCNNLKPDIFLLSVTSEVPYDCLMLMDHLPTLHGDLQEIPLSNTDFL